MFYSDDELDEEILDRQFPDRDRDDDEPEGMEGYGPDADWKNQARWAYGPSTSGPY